VAGQLELFPVSPFEFGVGTRDNGCLCVTGRICRDRAFDWTGRGGPFELAFAEELGVNDECERAGCVGAAVATHLKFI
jgi:hypothetical protein